MSRAKHPTVQTFAPGPSDAARAELWGGIHKLLVFANLHRDDPSPEVQKVHHVLTLLSEASDRWYAGDTAPTSFHLPGAWPAGAVVALANLAAILREGRQGRPRLYVRRCSECRAWCLTKDKRQKRRCHRGECFRAAESRRVGKYQRDELASRRKAKKEIRACTR